MYIILSNGESPKYLKNLITLNKNNTRGINKLIMGKPKNNFEKTSFRIGGPKIWNELPNKRNFKLLHIKID